MASFIPIFDQTFIGSFQTVTKDDWYNLTTSLAGSVIPTGKQIWLGYGTFISEDKSITFEIRPNLATKSAGNTTDTQLRAFTAVSTGDSRDIDFYLNGAINTYAPPGTDASTGVEKLWLRVKSGSQTVGTFDYIIYYALY